MNVWNVRFLKLSSVRDEDAWPLYKGQRFDSRRCVMVAWITCRDFT